MNIKYICSIADNGKVHVKELSYKTACGTVIDVNPENRVDMSEAVTCQKNGCCN